MSRGAGAGALEFVLLAALWGGSFLFMHIAAVGFGPVTTAGLRVAVAALSLAPVLASATCRAALRRYGARAMFAGLLNAALPFLLFTYAVLHLPTGVTAILNATTPLFGAAVAWAWLGDRPGGTRLAGLGIGFAGVAWLAARGGGLSLALPVLPVLACLGATCSYGVAASFVRRHLAGVPPAATTAGSMAGAALALAVPATAAWPGTAPTLQAWLAVAAAGVLCTALAYFLYYRIVQRAGPAQALAVTFLAPLFAVTYGAVLLDEPVTPAVVGSGLVILLGTLLASGLAGRGHDRDRTTH